jgi:DNA polymerase-3 subunit delta'
MHTYENISGNAHIIDYLKRAVQHSTVSHAYIFSAGPGMGKRLLADTFAKALVCELAGPEPCGVCPACRAFENNSHTDVIYVTSEKKSIGVDEIRGLNDDIAIRPYKSQYKIYIIPDAETMTPQAQNALLKTLEEPPLYGVILMLSDKLDNMLPTLRSRSIILKLQPLSDDAVRECLIRAGIKSISYPMPKP